MVRPQLPLREQLLAVFAPAKFALHPGQRVDPVFHEGLLDADILLRPAPAAQAVLHKSDEPGFCPITPVPRTFDASPALDLLLGYLRFRWRTWLGHGCSYKAVWLWQGWRRTVLTVQTKG